MTHTGNWFSWTEDVRLAAIVFEARTSKRLVEHLAITSFLATFIAGFRSIFAIQKLEKQLGLLWGCS